MNAPRIHNLTTGSIPAHLARLSIPMIWGILAIVSMQVADVYFISRLGQTELESISFTFPVSMTMFNLVMGLSIGSSSIIARLIGARDTDTMRHFTLHAIMIAFGIGAILAAIGTLMIDPLFHTLGAEAHHMAFIRPFIQIQLWGYMFITVPLVINAAIRASGDTVTPSLIMISAAFINIPLSYILIYGAGPIPAFGMTGAAIANVTANAIGAMIALYILVIKRQLVDLRRWDMVHFGSSAQRLLTIAAPVGLMNVMQPLTVGIITAILASSGAASVAAYGIVGRIEALGTVVLMALSIGMSPLIGQNFGSNQFDRVKETLHTAIKFALIWSIMMGVFLMLSGATLAGLFTKDPTTIDMVAFYFWIMGISRAVPNIVVGWGSLWYATGKPQYGMVNNIGILGLGTLLPGSIGHIIAGWQGLFIGIMIGGLIMGMALHFWSATRFDQFIKRSGSPPARR